MTAVRASAPSASTLRCSAAVRPCPASVCARCTAARSSLALGELPSTRRIEIITPRDPGSRGCQLSLRVDGDPRRLFRTLEEQGFVGDFRPPDVIRVAPVPLYNTFHEVWRFAGALAQDLGGAAERRS